MLKKELRLSKLSWMVVGLELRWLKLELSWRRIELQL